MFHIDPVCKKKIRRKEEYAILRYGGNLFYFCCRACQQAFQKSPLEYIPEGDKKSPRNNPHEKNVHGA